VAQTVAALALEPRTEAIFHDDSYGYRPRKGALDAVAACRQRCWEKSWVIDLDIRKFFHSVPWDLVIKAVQVNVTHEQRWITLYVRRWLAAPHRDARRQDGGTGPRDNTYLVRWAKRKYKRLRTFKKVRTWWEGLTARQPRLFAHWAWMTDSKYSL
jgi:hypothetical protein